MTARKFWSDVVAELRDPTGRERALNAEIVRLQSELDALRRRIDRDRSEWANHSYDDHEITGDERERMRRIIARHLCGWITGHAAPLDHFLVDADLVLADVDQDKVTPCKKCGTVGCAEDATSGWYDFPDPP